MDTILPAPGTIGRLQEAKLRMRDLTMAQIFNSNERGIAEWKELLETTVPKLKLSTWRQPSGSAMAVMEVTLYH
jgi:6-hydroxytryprostatin B O-methyltransferase